MNKQRQKEKIVKAIKRNSEEVRESEIHNKRYRKGKRVKATWI